MEATIAVAMPQADFDLVQQCRYGDAEAFEEIYHRYSEMIYNLAARMSGDRELAADLTQEIFLRAYRSLERFRGGASLKTWLYRVAVNHCRSRLGRRRWWFSPLAEEHGEEGLQLPDLREGPEEKAVQWDRRRHLSKALAALPATFREAVVLCDLQGLEYQEIAEVLGVRIGTVRSRIARGREKLRAHLDEALLGKTS
jgi:RNA polymerase sigma-70 factor, ECF subfamily